MTPLPKFAAVAIATGAMLFASISAQASPVVFDTVASFNAAVTNVLVEDFEGAPWEPANAIKPQPVVDQGLFWYSSNYLVSSDMTANRSALSITDVDPIFGGVDNPDMLWVVLPSGVNAVGVFVSTNGQQNQGVQIRALDAADNVLLDAITPATGPDEFVFIGVASLFDIHKVEFASISGPPDDDFFLDDFHYGEWNFGLSATANAVDEPTILAMFGGMLTILGFTASRRRQ